MLRGWVTVLLAALMASATLSHLQFEPPPVAAEEERESRGPGQPVRLPALQNTFRLSPGVWSGSRPEDERAYMALRDAGIRTIVCVDGAAPNAAWSEKFGLRCVHLPFGYDGIPAERVVQLVAVMRSLPGPVYVHCHHGKHRGPAAAAVMMMSRGKAEDSRQTGASDTPPWDVDRAIAWLHQAQTSPDYPGLYQEVRSFRLPSAKQWRPHVGQLPPAMPVPPLTARMVELERIWDELRQEKRPEAARPKLVLLREQFHELTRLPSDEHPALDDAFRGVEELCRQLEQALKTRPEIWMPAESLRAIEARCVHCHAQERG